MTIDFMRWCDRWVGKPAAFLIWLISPLLHPRSRFTAGQRYPDAGRITVIKFFGMGSLLLGTPAFRALRKAYPEASFEIITSSDHRSFIESLRLFDRIHGVSLSGFGPFLKGIFRLLLSPRPDISINLEYYTWSTLALQTIQRARLRVGFAEHQWLRRRLLDVPVYFNPHHHIRRIFGAVAEMLGAPVESYELLPMAIEQSQRNQATIKLREGGYRPGTVLIAIHIGASPLCRLRQWPLDRFQALTRLLIDNTEATILLVGGREEADEANNFVKRFGREPRLINLVGALSIPATIALLGSISLLITNDSGLLHWGVAVDTPTISFFGPETPRLYGPPRDPRHRVFYSGRYCSPCLTTTHAKLSDCRVNLCLQDIGVTEVYNAARELLNELSGKATIS